MKTHYNDADLFNAMMNMARALGRFARCDAILDYATPREQRIVLTNHAFDVLCVPTIGTSEGIYIDVILSGKYNHTETAAPMVQIGTLKTLGESCDDMMIMGEACGLLTWCAYQFVNDRIDAFSESGADIASLAVPGTGKIAHARYAIVSDAHANQTEDADQNTAGGVPSEDEPLEKRYAPDIVIELEGGLVQLVKASNPYTRVMVIDRDAVRDSVMFDWEREMYEEAAARAAESDMVKVY